MLSVRKLSIFNHIKNSVFKICSFSTFTPRDILDNSDGEAGTLNSRFIKHIAIELMNKNEKIIKQTVKYADYFPISNLHHFCRSLNTIQTEQLPRLIIFAYTYKTNGDPHKLAVMINEIDNLCIKRLNEFDTNGILSMLYAFTYLIPNKITKLQFYRNAIKQLITNSNPDNLTKEQFVQICYYLGLWKKNSDSTQLMKIFLNTNLNKFIDKLDTMNFAIVANSAFKTSCLQLNDDFTKRLINETINCNYKDDALLITFIKCLRLERIKSEEILNKLKSLIINDKLNDYHFKGLIHIFAYFSDNLWNDNDVCDHLTKLCMNKIEKISDLNEEIFNDVREKDIATFLWCLSYLRYDKMNDLNMKSIENLILSRIYNDRYRYCPDELIDTVLSLWTLNYKSEKLVIPHITKLNTLMNTTNKIKNNERIKLNSRLKLLMNCIMIEKSEWLPKNLIKSDIFNENLSAPEYLLKSRDNLHKVFKLLDENKEVFNIQSINTVSPINELNIPNIKIDMQNGQKLHIEVLENNQMLKFNDMESSLVHLKTRLMASLNCNTIVVRPKEVESNDDDIIEKLKTKILNFESKSPQAEHMIN